MKETILQKFFDGHPDLMKLKPKIWISEFVDENGKLTGIFEITIQHEFIFDNRLIPDSFEGINIQNVTIGNFPKEFPSSNAALPLWKWFSAQNYENFVNNNLELIRSKLNQPDLSKQDALDALTINFNKLISNNKKLEEKMRLKHDKHMDFFNKLLSETRQAYEKSEIYPLSIKNNWSYSVTATGIFIGKPLIVGFNWGAAQGDNYKPQRDYPFEHFEGLYDDLGSFKRTIPYFHDFYPKALTGMQTNFCFFRSQRENQISAKDLQSSLPLFLKYVEYSKPSILITFSSSLKNHLIKNDLLVDYQDKMISSSNKLIHPLKGQFVYQGQKIKLVYLPHPNTPVTSEARKKSWEFCFK